MKSSKENKAKRMSVRCIHVPLKMVVFAYWGGVGVATADSRPAQVVRLLFIVGAHGCGRGRFPLSMMQVISGFTVEAGVVSSSPGM